MPDTYKCKKCSANGFATPLELAHHTRQAHPKPKARKKRVQVAPPPACEHDGEIALMINITALFDEAELEEEQASRVLAYLTQRYGGAA